MANAAQREPDSDDIFLAVYESLVRYWVSRQVSEDRAKDLAQEGIVKCLQKIDKWKRKASLKTFLIEVGKNAGRDILRKEARREKLLRRGFE